MENGKQKKQAGIILSFSSEAWLFINVQVTTDWLAQSHFIINGAGRGFSLIGTLHCFPIILVCIEKLYKGRGTYSRAVTYSLDYSKEVVKMFFTSVLQLFS